MIREILEAVDLPTATLARDAGVSRATVHAWQTEADSPHARNPQPANVARLAEALEARGVAFMRAAARLRALLDELEKK